MSTPEPPPVMAEALPLLVTAPPDASLIPSPLVPVMVPSLLTVPAAPWIKIP